MLYDKLFPNSEDSLDNLQLYVQCLKLSWIELKHLGINFDISVEHLLSFTNHLMNQLNIVKTPNEKVEKLSMILDVILNTLKLY